jgi:hypothetical protein
MAEETESPIAATTDPLRARLAALGTGAAWLVGLRAGLELLRGALASAPLAEAVFGAFVLDVAAGRAGIAWSPPLARARYLAIVARGAAIGAAVPVACVAVALALGWARATAASVEWTVALSLVGAIGTATRDELLFRAFPLTFAARAGVPRPAAVAFAAVLSLTPELAIGHPTIEGAATALGLGLLCARLWTRAHGGIAAVSAHTAALLALGPLSHGAGLEIAWQRGELTTGLGSKGPAAWLYAALSVVVASVVVARWPAVTPSSDEHATPSSSDEPHGSS